MVHLQENGYDVETIEVSVPELRVMKEEVGVPLPLAGCHTAEIGGYIIEGHVPADVIDQLLAERPDDLIGLALPGMPPGSPGMGGTAQGPLEILAFNASGETWVYARR